MYIETKGKAGPLWKLYRELVIKKGMSYEKIAKVVDIALHELPDMESRLEQTTRAASNERGGSRTPGKAYSYSERRRKNKEHLHCHIIIILIPIIMIEGILQRTRFLPILLPDSHLRYRIRHQYYLT